MRSGPAARPSGGSPPPAELAEIRERFDEIVALATSNTVVMDRFKGTAVLSAQDAAGIGTLGVVARASGLTLDARIAHPFTDPGSGFRPARQSGGDVMARFTVRADEVRASLSLIAGLAGQAGALSAAAPRGTAPRRLRAGDHRRLAGQHRPPRRGRPLRRR